MNLTQQNQVLQEQEGKFFIKIIISRCSDFITATGLFFMLVKGFLINMKNINKIVLHIQLINYL